MPSFSFLKYLLELGEFIIFASNFIFKNVMAKLNRIKAVLAEQEKNQ